MRMLRWWAVSALLLALPATAIEPEQVGKETLGDPESTWVIVKDVFGPRYIFDAANGQMVGLLSTTSYTPAVATHPGRREIYAAESYYSRATRGERSDVVTIYDYENLAAIAEIEIPNKIAALAFLGYISLLDDGDHLAVFNLTPAQSVSIVDVAQRRFVTEISTAGCSLILPVADRGFLQICADGRLQLIRLDENGEEVHRSRSSKFFDLEDDPVFDKPVATPEGWLLTTYGGQMFDATVRGNDISISKPWDMLTDEDREEGWSPGGGQFIAYHAPLDLIFVLMNAGGEFTHDDPGSEIWYYNRSTQQRVARLPIEQLGTDLHVTPSDPPLLTVTGGDAQLHVFDIQSTRLLRSIPETGAAPGLLQGF